MQCDFKLAILAGVYVKVFSFILGCAGSDRLSMYGFHIHACIDCGSAFTVYAASDLNPEPDTMFDLFTEALSVFGHPTVVHTQELHGAEDICEEIEWQCGHDKFITGPHQIAAQVGVMGIKSA